MALWRRFWQGRLGFAASYWLWGVGGNMGWLGLLIAIYLLGGPRALASLWAVYLLSLGWFAFIHVGIWRAAGRYRGPRGRAWLARAGLLAGVVRMSVEAGLLVLLTAVRT